MTRSPNFSFKKLLWHVSIHDLVITVLKFVDDSGGSQQPKQPTNIYCIINKCTKIGTPWLYARSYMPAMPDVKSTWHEVANVLNCISAWSPYTWMLRFEWMCLYVCMCLCVRRTVSSSNVEILLLSVLCVWNKTERTCLPLCQSKIEKTNGKSVRPVHCMTEVLFHVSGASWCFENWKRTKQ